MRLSFVTLDVFTETQLIGNPLAIIHLPLSTPLTQDVKQAVAREFNLSEIVFLHEQSTEDVANEEVKIDIFTAYAGMLLYQSCYSVIYTVSEQRSRLLDIQQLVPASTCCTTSTRSS
jgi:PhzF family phenazine biosynthesis protein